VTTSMDALAGIAAIDAANEAEGGGADSGGWNFNQVSSVLNVAPTTSSGVYKVGAGLYDKTNPATAATSEGLYPGRKDMMKAAGVTYGTQGYKDWDAATRALMGVKQGDKFSSGQWIETFGGGSTSGQNAAEADYLSPSTKMGLNKFKQDYETILSGISVPLSGNKQFYLDDEETTKYGLNLGQAPSVRSLNPMDINSPYPSIPMEQNVSLDAMRTLTQDQAANKAAAMAGVAYPKEGGISLLEAAGYKYGTAGIAPFRLDATPGAGAYYSPYYDEIVMSSQSLSSDEASKKTRHELMHRLVQNMTTSGALSEIAVPQLEEIFDKFDVEYKGKDPTAQDFMNFVNMNSYGNLAHQLRSPLMEWDEETKSYVRAKKGGYSMDWDPRMRTAGKTVWDRWEKKELTGQDQWDKWVSFQRELPSEKLGGAVAGSTDKWGQYQTGPWGPATVNYRFKYNPDTDEVEKVPLSTGSGASLPIRTDPYGNSLPAVHQQVGLGNWPMGDEHALLAAQAARYPATPGEDDWYGDLARFNRKAALVAHPDSRVRAIHDANLPDIVLDRMQDYLMETGLMWNEDMTYSGAMDYLSSMLSEYEMDKIKATAEQGD